MPSFNWTPQRLQRVRQAVRSYNAAIDRQAKKNELAGISNDYLPDRITVAEVKEQVLTTNDFRRIVGYKNDKKRGRPSQLDRILPSVNKTALEPAQMGDMTVSNYQKKEQRYKQAAKTRRRNANRKAADRRAKLEGEKTLDEMSAPEYAARVDGTDFYAPDEGEFDEDIERMWREEVDERTRRSRAYRDSMNEYRREEVLSKMNTWLGVWNEPKNLHQNYNGYDEVNEQVKWMYENAPQVLNEMFESGSDEAQEDFIYLTPTSSAYAAIPYMARHNSAVKFVDTWYMIAKSETQNGE